MCSASTQTNLLRFSATEVQADRMVSVIQAFGSVFYNTLYSTSPSLPVVWKVLATIWTVWHVHDILLFNGVLCVFCPAFQVGVLLV